MTTAFERELWKTTEFICGVDEVGRGPLAGAVVAAAVMFEKNFAPRGNLRFVSDSKRLDSALREALDQEIRQTALAVGVGSVEPEIIDHVNILQATFLAMNQAIEQLSPTPQLLLIDGNRFKPALPISYQTIVKGDTKVFSIAAASIVAKVHRDKLMKELHTEFPEYGFDSHFGYPVPAHIEAIRKYGRSAVHRKSFKLAALGEK